MKNLLMLSTVFFINIHLFAQAQKPAYTRLSSQFEAFYNKGAYDSIFNLFDAQMKQALPLDKTADLFTNIKKQFGLITQREFINYQSSYAIYKTTFQRGLLSVNISLNNTDEINGLFLKPYAENAAAKKERTSTKLSLPFKDEWTVFWGGDTKEQNYHIVSEPQKNAFDFLMVDDKGKSYKTNGQTNEDYYAYGKALFAPSDGEVVMVVDGVHDNKPGTMNPAFVPGNTVVIKTPADEFIFLAHFKKHTIQVKEGQKVKRGDLLGRCGNSGNSSEPHLHLHVQNTPDMNNGTGIKAYFEQVRANGAEKKDYSPVKGDKIEGSK